MKIRQNVCRVDSFRRDRLIADLQGRYLCDLLAGIADLGRNEELKDRGVNTVADNERKDLKRSEEITNILLC